MKNFIRFLINILLGKLLYRVKYINKENETNLDKCIICPNHSSLLDPLWIYAKTYDIHIMAKAQLFENKYLNKIFRYFGAFPVNRNGNDASNVLHALHLFKNSKKEKLLIFPEGTVIHSDKPKGQIKVGSAYIASKSGVPIVPVYITKNPKLFSSVNIIYGNPIYVDKDIIKDRENLKKFDERLLNVIYELNNEVVR